MNMTSLKCLSAAVAAVLLAGCASTGERLDAAMGQPVDQLVQALGAPDADFRLQSGERVLQWNTWSTRKTPRYVYSVPRMSYAVNGDEHTAGSSGPQALGQPFDTEAFQVDACVVWALLDDNGNIKQGAAHGRGC